MTYQSSLRLFFCSVECFRLVSEGEEKEIVLKCDSEEARNTWLQKVVKASISFSQAKRKRNKEMKEKSKCTYVSIS